MRNEIQCLSQTPYFTRTPKTLFFIAALTVLFFLQPGQVYSREVYLAWDPNQESDLAGYRIYYGTTSGSHAVKIDVGNTLKYALTDLAPGQTYYFAVTAYDTSGNESDYSKEVSFHLPGDGDNSGQDGDHDGIEDTADNCPSDANANQADADGDGLGDACDPLTDSDDDGMPDDWEIQNGLDPDRDDAAADPDDDGISNLDEYLGETDPGVYDENDEPDAPVLVAPVNHETVGLIPQLQIEEFYDPDFGDTHRSTQWQITRQSDDRVLLDVTSDYMLTALPVPKMVLAEDAGYRWRARVYDNHGLASAWSQSERFNTDIQTADSDGNGILDDQEVDPVLDLDEDGTADRDQEDIKCVNIQGAAGQIGISIEDSPAVVAIEALESLDPSDALFDGRLGGKPTDITFGLIHFKLLLNEVGAHATVRVHLSQPAPAGSQWFKFHPIAETWLDYSDYAVISSDRRTVTLTIIDGGYGDLDGIANGIIIDPSGLGTPSDSGGGGDSIIDEVDDTIGDTIESLADNLACFITAAQQPQTARPANSRHDMGGGLVSLTFLLLVVVAVGRKFKPLKSIQPTAKTLGVGCIMLAVVIGTTPDTHARDTTPPGAPTGLKVALQLWGDDDASSDITTLKVFIVAGQSNMIGHGTVTPSASHLDRNGGMGTLEYLVNDSSRAPMYDHLVTSDGQWIERDDVWIVDLNRSGPLSVGYGTNKDHIGPEMQFGHVIGDYYENPVLIIKTSWGGKSLFTDFRPPSSGGELGPYYTIMVERVREVLGNIKQFMPDYQGQGYEIAGFGWHQGWNDRISQTANDEYQRNCVNFINDLRQEFQVSDLPFVLATTGMSGWSETHPRALSLMAAQLAVPDDDRLNSGKVFTVETRDFYREPDESPADQGYHWNRNAETYFLIGNGMGEAMVEILSNASPPDTPSPTKYQLAVLSGSGDGNYPSGAKVTITADAAPSGKVFDRWQVNAGSPSITEVKAATTTLAMGSGPATITATYRNSTCVAEYENDAATLSCSGDQRITSIEFASYGTPSGSCTDGYTQGSCHAADSLSIVEAACLNRSECKVSASNGVFGDPCSGVRKRIAIAYTCSDDDGGLGDPLESALDALQDHVTGAATLSPAELNTQKEAVIAGDFLFESKANMIADALAVVSAYESSQGPLWLNDATRNVTIPREPAGGLELEYAMIAVMQGLVDHAYVPGNLTRFRDVLDGAKFETSRYFPGAVDPPANPAVSYDAKINASQPAKWGAPVMFDDDPARRPTGCYVAPGSIVTVDVPPSIVGKGYSIRVGAHSWDLKKKPRYERLDRVSLVYPITATRTLVGNPLGGGIYIEVPPLADAGIVTITITNAVRSPFYSDKPFHKTSLTEWLETERHHPAPWADFESEKFMMQVPTNWIYAYDSPDITMENWDIAMDMVSDLTGKPRVRNGQTVLYMQIDVIIKGSAYHPGYPMSNDPYDPLRDEKGYKKHYFLTGPGKGTSTTFHELGHAELITKFPGETEAVVNFLYVAALNQGFGYSLDRAFSLSMGNKETISLDQAAIMWLVTENFRQGNPMNITNSTKNEVRYQHRGYAKYTEIANLFGWEALNDFWHSVNVDYMNGITYNRNNDEADSRILRMSRTAGADLRPLVHFWGVHPNYDAALKAELQREGLMPSALIYDRLMHYKTLIPMNNAEFVAHADIVYPERNGTGHVDYGKGWYSVWDQQYNQSHGTAAQAALQDIIDHYFPDGRPSN